ncbi:MAG TPA: DUF6321 domain-containing protein [Pyrinomonadaceae bacterium]|jgi:hypothetical protein|nr:DUF6321 domain-containing protein [Pyrinomonadaceae bacterium]
MATKRSVSMTSEDKNPQGGLSAKGRAKLKTAGQNIKPGVTKKDADLTPEDVQRKGSFLRRHYAIPRFDLVDKNGEPTRFALQAQAWGERLPKNDGDVKKLAAKGERLLAKFHKLKDAGKKSAAKKSGGKKTAAKK